MLAAACARQPAPYAHRRTADSAQRSAVADHFWALPITTWKIADPTIEPWWHFAMRAGARLIEQLAWLRENGYQAVSVDQILAARRGGPALPPKAVMLSFDDGYSSFYTRVMPILRAYHWPALLAPVGSWIDAPLEPTSGLAGTPRPGENS